MEKCFQIRIQKSIGFFIAVSSLYYRAVEAFSQDQLVRFQISFCEDL